MGNGALPILDFTLATDRIFMADGRFGSEADIEPSFGESDGATVGESCFAVHDATALRRRT